jgi:hypothetical protein
MSRYAPSLVLRRKLAPSGSYYTGDEPERPVRIQWWTGDGLTTLLHELGHHVLRHNQKVSWRAEIMEEVEAWLWAEKTARLEKIDFDYKMAEESFAGYFTSAKRRQAVSIIWRWRNGNGGRHGD